MPLFVTPVANFQTKTGAALSDSKLFFFENNTTTPKKTFADPGLTLENPQPVPADGAGDYPPIWLEPGGYTVQLRDSSGVVRWQRSDINVESEGLLSSTVTYFTDHNSLKAGNTIGGQQITFSLGQTLGTQGYNTPGDDGDSTYFVVPGGTGTPDDILFLDLDGSPLLAQRLITPVRYFQIVNLMQPALWLGVGDMAVTYGQITPNDGNGAFYRIVPGGTGVADNFNFVNLNNGNQAERLLMNVV